MDIVGEISYKPPGKRRHIFQLRTFVFLEDPAYRLPRMKCFGYGLLFYLVLISTADAKNTVSAGQFQGRGAAEERIASPFLIIFCAFQKIAVAAGRPQRSHYFYWGEAIGVNLACNGDTAVDARFLQLFSNL